MKKVNLMINIKIQLSFQLDKTFADQTCDKNTSCVFSKHQALFEDLDMCQDVYGVSAKEVYERVAFTNAYYGGRTPKGTRIVFVNGK